MGLAPLGVAWSEGVSVGPSGCGLVWGKSDHLWGSHSQVTDFQNSDFAAACASLVDVALVDPKCSVQCPAVLEVLPCRPVLGGAEEPDPVGCEGLRCAGLC